MHAACHSSRDDKWDEPLNFKDFESISVYAPDGKLTFDVEISTDIVANTFRSGLFYRLNVFSDRGFSSAGTSGSWAFQGLPGHKGRLR